MFDSFVISRRKAAMFFAGTLAASASTAAAVAPTSAASESLDCRLGSDPHQHIRQLLRDVRRAHDFSARAQAFERCKAALLAHELCRTAAPPPTREVIGPSGSALYRPTDPAAMLVRVIARELDELPQAERAWMQRFGDLEAVFERHATAHEGAARVAV